MEYIDPIKFKEIPIKSQEILKQYHKEYHKLTFDKGIPIMGETELRCFIQTKLDYPNIYYVDGELCVEYECNKGIEDCDVAEHKIKCDDMLEGYWKIACMIAGEEVKEREFWRGKDESK